MGGEVCHFEIPADDVERARRFYARTFGWSMDAEPGGGYTMVRTGEVDREGMPKRPGYIGGGIAPRTGLLPRVVVTIRVDDMTAAEKAVEQNGGRVLQKRVPIGDGSIGFAGYIQDPEGNLVGLFELPKGA